MKTKTEQGGRKPSRRQERYGKLVRGWDWRTDPHFLEIAEQARLKLKISRTEFIEIAIAEKIRKTNER